MGTLALLLAFPLIWPFIAKLIFKKELVFGEILGSMAIGVVVVLIGYYGGMSLQTRDIEIINGQVLSKDSHQVSCEHSYSCNCRQTCSGSGNNRSCSQTCDTCYEHSFDISWQLDTSTGPIVISRVDKQGLIEPPRFSRAQRGDPVATEHAFTNYIKAAPDSLLNTAIEQKALSQFASMVPKYPDTVYDYHYLDRVLSVGVPVPDLREWNLDLAQRLRTLGPLKQANVVIVFVKSADPQFATALRAAWLGGKKNDVLVVIGAPSYPAVEWVRVISWTDKELFKVELRDELFFQKKIDRTAMLDSIESNIKKSFVRKKMRDFEYLKADIVPPTWLVVLLFILSIAASVGSSVLFSRNGIRAGSSFSSRRQYR